MRVSEEEVIRKVHTQVGCNGNIVVFYPGKPRVNTQFYSILIDIGFKRAIEGGEIDMIDYINYVHDYARKYPKARVLAIIPDNGSDYSDNMRRLEEFTRTIQSSPENVTWLIVTHFGNDPEILNRYIQYYEVLRRKVRVGFAVQLHVQNYVDENHEFKRISCAREYKLCIQNAIKIVQELRKKAPNAHIHGLGLKRKLLELMPYFDTFDTANFFHPPRQWQVCVTFWLWFDPPTLQERLSN